ncbi:hypothetical protein RCCS2_08049 [Roseobacter sp. CCS2]|nr:hypothetical protein RCCS2_08049 [Roseobacter sp. CCS2]
MPESPLSKLHHVLDLEKQALMGANFEPLAQLLQQKEELLTQLAPMKPAKDVLRGVKQKMDENQTLLGAAIKGVAAAGERLEALNNVQKTLSVYDPSGRVELVSKHSNHLEKKA